MSKERLSDSQSLDENIAEFHSGIESASIKVTAFLDEITGNELLESVFAPGLTQVQRYTAISNLEGFDTERFRELIRSYLLIVLEYRTYLNSLNDDSNAIEVEKRFVSGALDAPSFFASFLTSDLEVLRDYYLSYKSLEESDGLSFASLQLLSDVVAFDQSLNQRFISARNMRLFTNVDSMHEELNSNLESVSLRLGFELYNQLLKCGFLTQAVSSGFNFETFLESDLYSDFRLLILDSTSTDFSLEFNSIGDVIISGASASFLQDFRVDLKVGNKNYDFNLRKYFHPFYHRNLTGFDLFNSVEDAEYLSTFDVSGVSLENIDVLPSIIESLDSLKESSNMREDTRSLLVGIKNFWMGIQQYKTTRVMTPEVFLNIMQNAGEISEDSWSILLDSGNKLSEQQRLLVGNLRDAESSLNQQVPELQSQIENMSFVASEFFNSDVINRDNLDVSFKRYSGQLKELLDNHL